MYIFLMQPQIHPQGPHKGPAPEPECLEIVRPQQGSRKPGQQIQQARKQGQLNPADNPQNQSSDKLKHPSPSAMADD
jgi:hypothetical protein